MLYLKEVVKEEYLLNIVVYCGASLGANAQYKQAAVTLGTWIAENNHALVYGGGKVGLMGIIADTVLQAGGKVIGVIPTFLQEREIAHTDLTELHVVETMSERKQKMLALGDACIALPGGPGTLEEIIEAVSWARVGQNDCPCIFYNIADYYEQLQHFFDWMVHEEFLSLADRHNILFAHSVDEMAQFITEYTPPAVRQYK